MTRTHARRGFLRYLAAVLDLLRAELTMVMRQAGTPSIGKISSSHILSAG